MSPLAGPKRSAKTLESTEDAVRRHVRQRRLLPVSLLCSIIAHRGPPLLQYREPHRAHERQELLRHIQIGQPFCVKVALEMFGTLFDFSEMLRRLMFSWSSFDIFSSPSQKKQHIFFLIIIIILLFFSQIFPKQKQLETEDAVSSLFTSHRCSKWLLLDIRKTP